MDKSYSALFSLLRSSLCNSLCGKEIALLSVNEWRHLIDLSFEQGIAAIAVDGLQKFYGENPDVALEIDKEVLEDLKYEWFGEVLQAEDDYREHCQKVKEICQIYADNGFSPILLKGLGLGLNYLVPEHRLCGDLDIFLAGGKSLDGDLMIRERLGLEVTKSKRGHHSHWVYKGLLVENHYELSNSYFGGGKSRQFEKELQTLIATDTQKISEESPFYLPSTNFNAIFLFWHLGTHFCSEKITLKQLCDLLMYFRQRHNEIDWLMVYRIWKQYGMVNFAYAIGSVLVKYFAMPESLMPGMIYDETMAVRIMDDILENNQNTSKGLMRILNYPRNAWKYRLVSGRSWIFPMFDSIWMHVVHSEDLLEKEI